VRFQSGSGFYPEGGVANIAIIREDTSVDDAFTVEYRTNGVTASGNTDYQSVKGQIRFEKGQNYRYINIPVYNDSDNAQNEFFQVTLSEFKTNNESAQGDITLANHLGIIVDKTHSSVEDAHPEEDPCVCYPTPTPNIPNEITIPWHIDNAPVIRYRGTCYYRTDICNCGEPCTIDVPSEIYTTCTECISGYGDVFRLCGEVFELCGLTPTPTVTPTPTPTPDA
tara:strand:- start:554 stop:1225 length:672 start_codon:yes stop_codon:yes gene_type:complete